MIIITPSSFLSAISALVDIIKNFKNDNQLNSAEKFLTFLSPELATKILKFLKLMTHDEDEIIALNASNGVDYIDEIMRNVGSVRMEKKITVLD